MEPTTDDKLRDTDIALIDALKMILEILVVRGVVKADSVQQIFAHQRDGYIAKEMPNAAVVMEVLRSFAVTPAQSERREALNRALAEPAQGTA
ncbi:MAG: hypothetical protein U1E56_14050 [Bauldia sp.]